LVRLGQVHVAAIVELILRADLARVRVRVRVGVRLRIRVRLRVGLGLGLGFYGTDPAVLGVLAVAPSAVGRGTRRGHGRRK
jgi:hypothetical protein